MLQALSLDAGGTLLRVAAPVAQTYAEAARALGHPADKAAVALRLRRAFARPWSGRRYVGDGRPFWRALVAEAVGVDDAALLERLYAHYAEPAAWIVDAAALNVLEEARTRGLRTALASNWDLRLRPLLVALGLADHFDHLHISAEVGVEKPDPAFFTGLCAALDVPPGALLHLGDDPMADLQGAQAAGCGAVLWRPDQPWALPRSELGAQAEQGHKGGADHLR
jgi:REG-2-like HAD superfamily hydrolase